MAAGLSLFILPLWPTARAHRHRIVICAFSLRSHSFSSPSYPPLGWRRSRSRSFSRRHRRSTHDPSISHFPRKMNGADFRLQDPAHRVWYFFICCAFSGRNFWSFSHMANPIWEKIIGLSSSFSENEIMRRRRCSVFFGSRLYKTQSFIS